MTVLHDILISDMRRDINRWLLDPVITVHPDQLMLEAFSTDESVYARLAIKQEAFESRIEPVYGTTNIDFTFDLRRTLQDLRSSRETVSTSRTGVAAAECFPTQGHDLTAGEALSGFLIEFGPTGVESLHSDLGVMELRVEFIERRRIGLGGGGRLQFLDPRLGL